MSSPSIRGMYRTLDEQEHNREQLYCLSNRLTRREELLIDLRVADEAIEMAQRYPEQLSAEFLAEQQKRRDEILAELKQMDEEVAK